MCRSCRNTHVNFTEFDNISGAAKMTFAVSLVTGQRLGEFEIDVSVVHRAVTDPVEVAPHDPVGFPELQRPAHHLLYPTENQIADKTVAILEVTNGRPSRRYHDLPDLEALARQSAVDGELLRRALFGEFTARGIEAPIEFDVPSRPEWSDGYRTYIETIPGLANQSIDDALHAVKALLDPLLNGQPWPVGIRRRSVGDDASAHRSDAKPCSFEVIASRDDVSILWCPEPASIDWRRASVRPMRRPAIVRADRVPCAPRAAGTDRLPRARWPRSRDAIPIHAGADRRRRHVGGDRSPCRRRLSSVGLGDHDADVDELVAAVTAIAARRVAVPYFEPATHRDGWELIGAEVAGRFVWHESLQHGDPYNVEVDGRILTWEKLGQAMEAFEGWRFRLVIEDSIDDARSDAEILSPTFPDHSNPV